MTPSQHGLLLALSVLLWVALSALAAFTLLSAVEWWQNRRRKREFGDYFADDEPARQVDRNGRDRREVGYDYCHDTDDIAGIHRDGGTS